MLLIFGRKSEGFIRGEPDWVYCNGGDFNPGEAGNYSNFIFQEFPDIGKNIYCNNNSKDRP